MFYEIDPTYFLNNNFEYNYYTIRFRIMNIFFAFVTVRIENTQIAICVQNLAREHVLMFKVK